MSFRGSGTLKKAYVIFIFFPPLLNTKEDMEKCKELDFRFLHRVQIYKREFKIKS